MYINKIEYKFSDKNSLNKKLLQLIKHRLEPFPTLSKVCFGSNRKSTPEMVQIMFATIGQFSNGHSGQF